MKFDLDFYIQGIEIGMIAALKRAVGLGPAPEEPDAPLIYSPDGYVKMITPYDGPMNPAALRKAISSKVTHFPLMYVNYVNGPEKRADFDSGLPDEPMTIRKDCRFAVVCCSNNARGSDARMRGAAETPGVYRMMSDAWTTLAGKRIVVEEDGEQVFLTEGPLIPGGDSPVMLADGITANAVYFDTFFHLDTPDRRDQDVIVISDINLTVGLISHDRNSPGGHPGVRFS